MNKILITGATGHLGTATINFLLEKLPASKIAALARSADKAADLLAKGIDVRYGNYFDYPSLVKAFSGIDTLALISSSEMKDRSAQQVNAVKAAKEAGVKHVVYTSMSNPSHESHFVAGTSHYDTEEAIKKSGMSYTFLRNGLYLEFLPMFIGGIPQSGAFYFPAGESRANFASRVDLAEALANALISDGHENKVYDLTIEPALTFGQVAKDLSSLSGATIEYVDISVEALKKALEEHGLPKELVDMNTGLAEAIKLEEMYAPSGALEELLGRKPLGIKEVLKELMAHAEETK